MTELFAVRTANRAGGAPEFPAYHDTEWGFPVAGCRRLFEKLSLEGFQSGLSPFERELAAFDGVMSR